MLLKTEYKNDKTIFVIKYFNKCICLFRKPGITYSEAYFSSKAEIKFSKYCIGSWLIDNLWRIKLYPIGIEFGKL
jgi:hypothetical protein